MGWLALVLAVAGGCDTSMKEVSQYTGQYVGADPHAFVDTEDMLRQDQPLPFDTNAARLIEAVSEGLEEGLSLESDTVWALLHELNPYRKTGEAQAAVAKWAAAAADQSWFTGTADSGGEFQANAAYRGRNFQQASTQYRQILAANKAHHDARSNLALSELHQRYDLTALVELKTLLEMKPDHLPALMNITVAYERLGLEEEAAGTARRAAYVSDYQGAEYNHAWFANGEGRYVDAEAILHPLAELNLRPSHVRLHDLNARQGGIHNNLKMPTMPRPSQGGVAAVINPDASATARYLLIGGFGVGSLILVVLAGMGRQRLPRAEGPLTLVLVVLLMVAFILFWGWPTGAGWAGWVLYVLVFAGLSGVQKAKS
ncbi:MAG: hypothetical protein IT368_09400 [Candidatus Hydrogenedentes bacterium]|nr:hypothetical protein [Candidatus Hydrogenedentota bacterium]